MMGRSYFVRAMSQTEKEFNVFFENSVVAVGWSSVDMSESTNIDKIVDAVDCAYYRGKPTVPQVVGRKLNEVRRFTGLSAGDQILVPYYSSVRLAVVENGQVYNSSPELDTDHLDLANQRQVRYLKIGKDFVEIPRTNLSHGLQSRLRMRGTTIGSLTGFETEIGEIFNDPKTTWKSRFAMSDRKNAQEWQSNLLASIQNGRTNLKAGGRGLEELVRDMLTLEGYQAKTLSTRRFPGIADADVEAVRADLFAQTKLLVQVKHHYGQSDAWGAKQLDEIFNDPEAFVDYQPVLVTTADSSEQLTEYCESKQIRLITGRELVERIYDQLERLSSDWRETLGIGKTGQLLF
ncbi:MAG TPA: restriction endonuclease [Nitrospira sp.]|nr:restriction endonuclease [Nitrospira sp.]